jgi:hypothetical protein
LCREWTPSNDLKMYFSHTIHRLANGGWLMASFGPSCLSLMTQWTNMNIGVREITTESWIIRSDFIICHLYLRVAISHYMHTVPRDISATGYQVTNNKDLIEFIRFLRRPAFSCIYYQ